MYLRGCFIMASALLLLAGCGAKEASYALQDVKGTDISHAKAFEAGDSGRRLALNDHNGRPVTLESFRGKLVVLFFGYTHCPDVCPTTLSDMSKAMKLLGPEKAAKVQVLFVSVDPQRDTPEILKAYVPYFDPGFLGLYGSPDQVARVAREFNVVYRKQMEAGAIDYLVDHSAGSYVIDALGKLRLYLPYAMQPEDIAHDLNAVLESS